ncbi:hypothetical protein [Tahibacter amnicola]|uniref:Uncharacterized protein n=1 Tax=Tahibacter amnicola TaxID=2976241 RepID=A0ABY6BLE3_9GAMM|nr:hypothetical protein [Tahibacter amnicola]UXI69860.1 hypothetical protein N4264_09600 [Tahibacter amnicola]
MEATMAATKTLQELATLRRQLAKRDRKVNRYHVCNEIFKRANALWRDGFLTAADFLEIRDEVDQATLPKD